MLHLLFFLFFSFLFIPSAFAQESSSVLISEIAWMGTPVQEADSAQWWRYEWIELYNATLQDVSLEDWTIEFSRDSADLTIPLSGTIGAQSHFSIVSSDKIAPFFNINYQSLAGRMANSGQMILLKDASGTIRESLDFRQGWPAGDNTTKHTMERISFQGSAEWTESIAPGGSPGTENTGGMRVIQLREAMEEKEDVVYTDADFHASQVRSFVFLALAALLIGVFASIAGHYIFFRKK
jgi:hypothetical protein